ncbi:flagellin [Billgrantia aerodenitrificans]|uniref:Flagellin n=1 Tax=Billgrantia aerodenitrificans TaxID=2733483 RepID=A0ABS9AV73_9GAMM|nr:flagellin [Halomonas aerodenitrificans]MCE8025783.1 flagellin FliC [Halomonas aerodenitrificans]
MSVINTNITSLIGQSNLQKSQNALQTSMERLSSGLRINSAKDDAAGQAIANRMTAQITGLNQAQRNANDGISVAQTAEGALNQINDNLQRIRELTVQAQNGTNSDNDLQSIQDEITQRLAEIDRISSETNFNGVDVLAQDRELQIQVGANDGETISVNLKEITSATLNLADFDVRRVVEVNTGDQVQSIVSGDLPSVTPTTTFGTADVDVEIAAGGVTLPPLPATFGTIDGAVSGANVTGFVTDSAGGLYATVELTGESTGNTARTETAYVAISASNVSVGGTVDLSGATFLTQTGGSNNETNATSASDLTFTFTDQPVTLSENFANAPAGTTSFVQDGDNLYIQVVDGDDTQLYAVSAGQISAGGTVTFDFDGVTADFSATTVSVDASALEGTLREVLDEDGVGTGTYVDDRGEAGLFLAAISAGGTATVQEATYTDAQGTQQSVEIRFGGIDGQTKFATIQNEAGEDVNYAVTGAGTDADPYVVDMDQQVALGQTGNPLAALDAALNKVDSLRSELGAVQNRFEDAINNLQTNSTNLQAARSRIEDADYAVEVANMTRAQILQQAGTSVLAQANQIPQNVLSLLG